MAENDSGLGELAVLWPLLDDAAVTMTTHGNGHPVIAAHQAPVRISILDIKRDVAEALTEIAHVLGVLDQDATSGISEPRVSEALVALMDIVEVRAKQPGWLELQTALDAILGPVMTRLLYLLGETRRPAYCPTCGQLVVADEDGDVLECPQCGVTGLPRYVDYATAAAELGVTRGALRLAAHRARLVPLVGSYPPRYRFDDLDVLCRRSRPRQAWHGPRRP